MGALEIFIIIYYYSAVLFSDSISMTCRPEASNLHSHKNDASFSDSMSMSGMSEASISDGDNQGDGAVWI